MISGRTLLVLALMAAGWWLWRSGEWQTVTARLSALPQQVTSTIDNEKPAGSDAPATPAIRDALTDPVEKPPTGPAAGDIRTWVDAQGTRHFASAAVAPESSVAHETRPATILEHYDQPLRESQVRAETADNQNPTRSAPDATTAAYELMDNLEKRLQAIRQENNR